MSNSVIYVPGHDNTYNSFKREMFKRVPQATAEVPQSAPVDLKGLFKSLGSYVKAHPYASFGTGVNAAANVAGLVDNDKLLGQGVGTALGYFAPQLLGMLLKKPVSVSPLMRANLAMGGGTLGSLFDNLRAKKEQEATMQQYGG